MGRQTVGMKSFSVVTLGFWATALSTLVSVAMFSAVSAAPSPAAPVLISPQHDSWLRLPEATLKWSNVAKAASYELRYVKAATCAVDTGNGGQLIAPDATVVSTTDLGKFVEGLADGSWCWQVRAATFFGKLSDWSEARLLRVDTAAPVISVKYPFVPPKLLGTADVSTSNITLVLDGVSRPDIKVSIAPNVNGAPTNDWSLTLPDLSKEDHTYALSAIDAAGNEKTTEQTTLTAKDLSTTEATIILPLVPTAPLVFIAPSHTVRSDTDQAPLTVDTARGGSASAKLLVGNGEESRATTAVSTMGALQASNEGWRVFGVAWYWWALSGGMSFWAWAMVSRVQLSARLSWIGTV